MWLLLPTFPIFVLSMHDFKQDNNRSYLSLGKLGTHESCVWIGSKVMWCSELTVREHLLCGEQVWGTSLWVHSLSCERRSSKPRVACES